MEEVTMNKELIKTDNYLLVVDDSEINPLCWCLDTITNLIFQYYTKRGLKITDKKIIAHLPLNNSPILQGVDLLPPLEQEDDEIYELFKEVDGTCKKGEYEHWLFEKGYNKAKEKYKYTEEDMRKAIDMAQEQHKITRRHLLDVRYTEDYEHTFNDNEIIQSLSQPKMPVGFECEIEYIGFQEEGDIEELKKYTNSQGQTVWIGKYIY
jgi:hypothetical protein